VRDWRAITSSPVEGPLLVEANFTTIVVDPGAVAMRTPDGSLSIRLKSSGAQ